MTTETISSRYADLDLWPTGVAVDAMLEGQLYAVAAVKSQVGAIARAVDEAAVRLRERGRLVYVGAGTSGRIAVQDGVELGPTYGWPADRLVCALAGGLQALSSSAEDAEDNAEQGERTMAEAGLGHNDVVIGVAASGTTPYTVAAIRAARRAGALTIGVANNPDAPLLTASECPVCLDTGSEPVAGSTRMKAGTAQKVALNLLSTALMVRLGGVYQGLMVGMSVSNQKLRDRAARIVSEIAGCEAQAAAGALAAADGNIKLAILTAGGMDRAAAEALLARSGGNLRTALQLAPAGRAE